VEGNYLGIGVWMPGIITKLCEGGTLFDIMYDNGQSERCKDRQEIRIDYTGCNKVDDHKQPKKCPMDHFFPEENEVDTLRFVVACALCETTPVQCFECGVLTYHINCELDHDTLTHPLANDRITTEVAAESLLALKL
jgi:hypothetical protein